MTIRHNPTITIIEPESEAPRVRYLSEFLNSRHEGEVFEVGEDGGTAYVVQVVQYNAGVFAAIHLASGNRMRLGEFLILRQFWADIRLTEVKL